MTASKRLDIHCNNFLVMFEGLVFQALCTAFSKLACLLLRVFSFSHVVHISGVLWNSDLVTLVGIIVIGEYIIRAIL